MKTRKQLLQELTEQIPENLSNLEKAAFVAKFVANQTAFDEHFWWGNTGERKKVYRLAKQNALNDTRDSQVHRKIICVTETSLFAYLAKNVGLKVGYLIESEENMVFESNSIYRTLENPEHITPVIKDEQDRWIRVDVQKDLANWNTGCRPEYFGTIDYGNKSLSKLSNEEIDDVLKNINYAKDGEEPYTDSIIERCIRENLDKSIEEQFEIILEDERILEYYKNLGPVEAYNFTKKLNYKMLEITGEKATKKMNLFVCFVKTSDDEREYNFGVFSDFKEAQWLYMFSKKQRKMVRVSKQEIKYMLDKDLILRGKLFNKGRLEKFVKGVNYDDIEKAKTDRLKADIMYEDEEK